MWAVLDLAVSEESDRDLITQALGEGRNRGLVTRKQIASAPRRPTLFVGPERPKRECRNAPSSLQLAMSSSESFNVKSIGVTQYHGFGLHQINKCFDVGISDSEIGRGQTTSHLHTFDAHSDPCV
jgi:hypothetical protein